MKKYILLIAIVVGMVLGFTACGSDTGIGEKKNNTDDQIENPVEIPAQNEDMEQKDSEMLSDDMDLGYESHEKNEEDAGEAKTMKMNVQIGDYTFTATLEENAAVEELLDMMKEGPVTIQMDDYSGFEKVGGLGRSLTTSNSQITTKAGDIVLYNGNNIVMFYGSNSWSYTRIGKIDDLSDWEKALGSGSVTVVFSIE